jgi:hypothetical protein
MMDLAEAGWVRAHYNQTSGKFVWPPGPTGPAPTYKKGTLPKVPPDLPLPGPKSTISIIEPTKISVYVPPEPTIIKPPKVKIIRPPEPEIYRPSPPEPAPPEPLPPEELPERERKLIKKKKKIEVAV